MNKLLIDEYPIMVLPKLAQKIGLNEAIFLQQLHYWLQKSDMEHDGSNWVYNTVESWQEQLPFWSEKTIKRIIARLKKTGLIECKKLKPNTMDRTNCYSIIYGKLPPSGQNDPIDKDKMTRCNIGTETTKEFFTVVPPNGETPFKNSMSISPDPVASKSELQDWWNALAAEAHLPKCRRLTDERWRAARKRFSEGMWEARDEIAARVKESEFLRGDNDRGWQCNLDFLLNSPRPWVRIVEGCYARKSMSQLMDEFYS